MHILVFTEGTILTHNAGRTLSREEIVKQVQNQLPSVHDFANYIPIGQAANKLNLWQSQGAKISYLTSRRKTSEIRDIQDVLDKYGFPNGDIYFRKENEGYKDVAERVLPDILIEDDCESIGGKVEMTYPHIKPDIKAKIKSVIIKEFGGISHLPDEIELL
jgi:hypothetical protein